MMTSGLVNGDKKMTRGKHLRGYLPGMKKPTKQVPTVIAFTINGTSMKKTGKTKQRVSKLRQVTGFSKQRLAG